MEACKRALSLLNKSGTAPAALRQACDTLRGSLQTQSTLAPALHYLGCREILVSLLGSHAHDPRVSLSALETLCALVSAFTAVSETGSENNALLSALSAEVAALAFPIISRYIDNGSLVIEALRVVSTVGLTAKLSIGPIECAAFTAVLSTHGSSAGMMLVAFFTLRLYCNAEGSIDMFCRTGVVEAFLSALKHWDASGNDMLHRTACTLLLAVARTEAGAKQLLALDGLTRVMAMMRLHPATVMPWAGSILEGLASQDGADVDVRAANVVPAAIEAVRHAMDECDADAEACTTACTFLRSVSKYHELSDILVEGGAVDVLMRVFARHPDDAKILEAACETLTRISFDWLSHRYLIEAGVCEAMLAAQRRHPASVGISMLVVRLLSTVLSLRHASHVADHHIDDDFLREHCPPPGSKRAIFMSTAAVIAAQRRSAEAGAGDALAIAMQLLLPADGQKPASMLLGLDLSFVALELLALVIANITDPETRASALALVPVDRLAVLWGKAMGAWAAPPSEYGEATKQTYLYVQHGFEALAALANCCGEANALRLVEAGVVERIVACLVSPEICRSPEACSAGFVALRNIVAYEACRGSVLDEAKRGKKGAGSHSGALITCRLVLKALHECDDDVASQPCTPACEHTSDSDAEDCDSGVDERGEKLAGAASAASSGGAGGPAAAGDGARAGGCNHHAVHAKLRGLKRFGGCKDKASHAQAVAAAAAAVCGIVRNVAASPALRKPLMASKWNLAVVQLLQRHASYPETVWAASGALLGLACEPENCGNLIAEGAAEAAVAVLKGNPKDARIAWAACGILSKLASSADGRALSALQERKAAGPALILALRRHAAAPRVVATAAAALRAIAATARHANLLAALGATAALEAGAECHAPGSAAEVECQSALAAMSTV